VILTVVLFGVCQIITVFGACLLLRHFINAKQAELEQRAEKALRSWVEAEAEGKPSKLAVMLDATGAVIGSAVARSIMASLNVDQSHMAKVANGLTDQLQAEQNPVLALLAGGKRGKGAAIMKLAQILGPMLAGAGANHGSDGGSQPPRSTSL